jgi:hypothetical protein
VCVCARSLFPTRIRSSKCDPLRLFIGIKEVLIRESHKRRRICQRLLCTQPTHVVVVRVAGRILISINYLLLFIIYSLLLFIYLSFLTSQEYSVHNTDALIESTSHRVSLHFAASLQGGFRLLKLFCIYVYLFMSTCLYPVDRNLRLAAKKEKRRTTGFVHFAIYLVSLKKNLKK